MKCARSRRSAVATAGSSIGRSPAGRSGIEPKPLPLVGRGRGGGREVKRRRRWASRACPRKKLPSRPPIPPSPTRGEGVQSELDVELLQLIRFDLGGGHPVLHLRQRHDGAA